MLGDLEPQRVPNFGHFEKLPPQLENATIMESRKKNMIEKLCLKNSSTSRLASHVCWT
jgi:hypothetical protein